MRRAQVQCSVHKNRKRPRYRRIALQFTSVQGKLFSVWFNWMARVLCVRYKFRWSVWFIIKINCFTESVGFFHRNVCTSKSFWVRTSVCLFLCNIFRSFLHSQGGFLETCKMSCENSIWAKIQFEKGHFKSFEGGTSKFGVISWSEKVDIQGHFFYWSESKRKLQGVK